MSFGRPYILKTDGCIHDGWVVISDNKELLDKDYLFYFLSSDNAKRQFSSRASGSTVENLNIDRVKETEIPLPPLAEQKKIVAELDALSEKVDRLRELQKSQLEDLKSLEQAYLKEAFESALAV